MKDLPDTLSPPRHFVVLTHFGFDGPATGWGHGSEPQATLGAAADWYAEASADGQPAFVLEIDPRAGTATDRTIAARALLRLRLSLRHQQVPAWLAREAEAA